MPEEPPDPNRRLGRKSKPYTRQDPNVPTAWDMAKAGLGPDDVSRLIDDEILKTSVGSEPYGPNKHGLGERFVVFNDPTEPEPDWPKILGGASVPVVRFERFVRRWGPLQRNAAAILVALLWVVLGLAPSAFPQLAGLTFAVVSGAIITLFIFLLWTVPAWPRWFNAAWKSVAALVLVAITISGERQLFSMNQATASSQGEASTASPNPLAISAPPDFTGSLRGAGDFTKDEAQYHIRPGSAFVTHIRIKNKGGPGIIEDWSFSAIPQGGGKKIPGTPIAPPPPSRSIEFLISGYTGVPNIIIYNTNTDIMNGTVRKVFQTSEEAEGYVVVHFPKMVKMDTLRVGVQDQNGNWYFMGKASPPPLP